MFNVKLMQGLSLKYDININPVQQYLGDILIQIKFKTIQDYTIAKQVIDRMAIIRMLTTLKTPDNHIFVRKFGYMDNTNRILIYFHRGDNIILAQDDPFITQIRQLIKRALKQQFKQKKTQVDPQQRTKQLPKQYTVRQSKQLQQGDSNPTSKSTNIYDYPKAKELFDNTIKKLRLKFKSLNDDELWAFGVAMYKFWKSYK